MQFQDLHIQYFRGFKNLEINDFQQINLFVGKNNSGKTSLLESLFLLSGIANTKLPIVIDSHRDIFSILDGMKMILGLEKVGHYLKMIYYELNENQRVILKSQLTNQYRKLEITPVLNRTSSTSSSNGSEKMVSGYQYDFTISENSKEKLYKSAIQLIKEEWSYLRDENYQESFNALLLNPRNMNKINYTDLLNDFILNKELSSVIEILQSIDKSIQNLVIDANAIIHCDTGLKRLIPLSIMGDGIKRILSIVLQVSECKNGVMLVDEVENGFHYSSLVSLWKGIFTASKKYNVQIFASTHSDECVKAYAEAYQEIYQNKKDLIRLYRIEKQKDSTHKAIKFDAENLKNVLEMNWEYR